MDFQPFINTIAQAGVWCIAAFVMGKMFIDYINKDKELDRQDVVNERQMFREERERLYLLVEGQGKILEQQRDMLGQQVEASKHNKEMLDKLTNIQMLHTNRLDRIEDRQSRLEEEVKEINRNLQKQ